MIAMITNINLNVRKIHLLIVSHESEHQKDSEPSSPGFSNEVRWFEWDFSLLMEINSKLISLRECLIRKLLKMILIRLARGNLR